MKTSFRRYDMRECSKHRLGSTATAGAVVAATTATERAVERFTTT